MGAARSQKEQGGAPAPVEARVRTLRLPVGGETFCATLVTPSPALPAVIFVHGWNGTQEFDLGHVRDAAGLGCAVLALDLRGHDHADVRHTRVSREDNLRDLLSAYDWLVAREDVDARAVGVVGFSYGAYLAMILSSLRRVQWLALRSPALYPDEGWNVPKHELDERVAVDAYRRRVQDADSDRALRACAAFEGDVLLVGSECDDVLPPQVKCSYAAALRRANSVTTRTIAGADHALSMPAFRRDWSELLEAWLREMIGGARKRAAVLRLETRSERIDEAADPQSQD